MSLREEIDDVIYQAYKTYDALYAFDDDWSDEIIKIFEKRIDARLENYRAVLHKDNDNDYTRGCLHAYESFKEMLKK